MVLTVFTSREMQVHFQNVCTEIIPSYLAILFQLITATSKTWTRTLKNFRDLRELCSIKTMCNVALKT